MSDHDSCSDAHETTHVLDEGALLEKCRKTFGHIDEDYVQLVFTALKNIDLHPPILISGGSSGSYFIHDDQNKIVGVFKPQDEEPYGINNPKWGKWLQKVLLPCSFGRGCLVPNQGYLSEAAAFLVDQFFGLGIVPETAVVEIASKVFHYNRFQRYEARARQRAARQFPNLGNRFNWSQVYKAKHGSFQRFMNGYMSSEDFLRTLDVDKLTEDEKTDLTVQLHSLFLLDYMTRNTDRKNANFLVRVDEVTVPDQDNVPSSVPVGNLEEAVLIHLTDSEAPVKESEHDKIPPASVTVPSHPPDPTQRRSFKIAAIDNGLAFPFKHPGEIRSYPFCWATYFKHFANQPFNPKLRDRILPILEDVSKVKEVCDLLKAEFMKDKRFRKKKTISAQLSVFRGQLLNLLNVLKDNKTPADLELARPVYLKELKRKRRVRAQPSRSSVSSSEDPSLQVVVEGDGDVVDCEQGENTRYAHPWRDIYVLKVHTQNPYLSCC